MEHNLKPEDIASVHIRLRSSGHTSPHLIRKYPRNAETADHSPFFLTAIAIKERAVDTDSIQPEKFTDPIVLDLTEKITIEADPTMSIPGVGVASGIGYGAKTEIVTKNGQRFEKHVVTPHGFGDDPLSDEELEGKFEDLAGKHMGREQTKAIFETVWNVDKLEDMAKLTKLMVFRLR